MTITTTDGQTPQSGLAEILQRVATQLGREGQKYAAVTMANCIRRHFQAKYPGSRHYSPDKVTVEDTSVVVDVPGITRAYKDLTIRPINAKHLAIPLHRSAYGLKPREVEGLFYAQNKRGTEMLAKTEGGALVVMYILKDVVHQRKDPTLMPSDQTLVDAITRNLGEILK